MAPAMVNRRLRYNAGKRRLLLPYGLDFCFEEMGR